MSDYICYLITILYEGRLLRVALKVKKDKLPQEVMDYCEETGSYDFFHSLLPLHVQTCGEIVEVEEIFEVVA